MKHHSIFLLLLLLNLNQKMGYVGNIIKVLKPGASNKNKALFVFIVSSMMPDDATCKQT